MYRPVAGGTIFATKFTVSKPEMSVMAFKMLCWLQKG